MYASGYNNGTVIWGYLHLGCVRYRLFGIYQCLCEEDMIVWYLWEDDNLSEQICGLNTQVPRYMLFCEGGIYSTHAH